MADNVTIIYGIIYGGYQSASGRMHKVQARENIIKYLTKPNDLEVVSELATQNNKWVSCKYILHMMLWGLRDDCHKALILQYMSDQQIAVLKDAISVAKGYKCPDRKMAKQASNNYTKKKKTQKLSIEDNVAWYSARIAIDVADNWDKMVAELDVWTKMIDEFKRDKSKGRKRREYMEDKDSICLRQQANYNEHRTEILEQKHLRNVCDDAKREEINAKRRERYKQNPEPYKERSRQRRLAQPADARKEYHSAYYQEKKAEKAQKAHERQEKLNQQIDSAMQMCAAYVLLMNLKKSKDKDEKKQYLELYTRKQEPLTDMLKICVALRKMDMNLCPFCNPDSEQMVEECCNKKVLAIPDAINQLQIIANDLLRQK